MPTIVLFNKPYDVLTQFRPEGTRKTLADFISNPSLRVAGRLDRDSEGLLLLTDDGRLNAQLTLPSAQKNKVYWVQVEGEPTDAALQQLAQGVMLNDGMTLPAQAERIDPPELWPRTPPVRFRAQIPTCWLQITLQEGRNRQVRRMTAAVGYPTLRLVRVAIGPYQLADLASGAWRSVSALPLENQPKPKAGRASSRRQPSQSVSDGGFGSSVAARVDAGVDASIDLDRDSGAARNRAPTRSKRDSNRSTRWRTRSITPSGKP